MTVEKKEILDMDVMDSIIRYENGNMGEKEEIRFFQNLINTGLCWKLQGHYGRVATHLLEEGLIIKSNDKDN